MYSVSLNRDLDHDHLNKVYDQEIYGRGIGKSVAHATYLLGTIEVNETGTYFVTGPNMNFLDHFRLLLDRVATTMGVPITHKNREEMEIAGSRVRFVPHLRIAEASRGNNPAIIFDVDDYDTDVFCPVVVDKYTIDEYMALVKREKEARQFSLARSQSDRNHRRRYPSQP